MRTEVKGESCIWKDYKAICANQQIRLAWFVENDQLVNWVNQQEFADLLTCLGDGHPGIWNLFKQINPTGNKQEILDWYHLIENLHKVGGSVKRLEKAESLLWQGKVDETLALISPLSHKEAGNFAQYRETHRHRILISSPLSANHCFIRISTCSRDSLSLAVIIKSSAYRMMPSVDLSLFVYGLPFCLFVHWYILYTGKLSTIFSKPCNPMLANNGLITPPYRSYHK